MASVGTGAVTGITIWVVADGRYEPQNFPFFHIDDSQLVWDWSTNLSNYTTLRVKEEAALKNAGWEIESSIALNEQLITNTITSGGQYFGGGGVGVNTPVDATQDYLPVGSADAGTSAGDAGYESAEQVREDDINTLFAGLTGPTVRVTRIRSDIAQSAMTSDFVLQASSDQSELSNVRQVTQSVNLTCPIYDGCTIIGTGTLAQAQASVGDGGELDATLAGGAGNPSGTSESGLKAAPTGGGGCATGAQGGQGSGVAFGALAGVLGLLVGRSIRSRRRRSRHNG
jgi:hypothetical protein